jgi:hypothetical protein
LQGCLQIAFREAERPGLALLLHRHEPGLTI